MSHNLQHTAIRLIHCVFADTGEVEVEYRESVEKYVTEHGGGASWTDVVGTLTAGSTSITVYYLG